MAFLEQRLDARVTRGAQGGPTVPGRIKTYLPNGKLQQSFNATMPLHKYDLSAGLRSLADFESVRAMWYVVMFTPYAGFRFKDEGDHLATPAITRLRQISGSSWQLQRVYSIATIEFLRDIQKPCALPPPVILDAAGNPLQATVDTTTGIATVAGTPASWVGQFDVPVTFTDDEFPASWEVSAEDLHMQPQQIKLEEIRL